MSVAVKIEEIDGVSVVGLNGRIVLGEESGTLRETVKNLIAAGKKKIVLDMSNVTYIDSAGLGILVSAHVSAKTQGASISLCALGQKFREVLQLTRLLTIFDVYETRTAAIDSFEQNPLRAPPGNGASDGERSPSTGIRWTLARHGSLIMAQPHPTKFDGKEE